MMDLVALAVMAIVFAPFVIGALEGRRSRRRRPPHIRDETLGNSPRTFSQWNP